MLCILALFQLQNTNKQFVYLNNSIKLYNYTLNFLFYFQAAILQQTAEYIYSLEQEKTRLLSQNCQLKRLLNQHEGGEVPLKKRKNEILSHVSSVIPADSTEDSTITNSRSPEPVAVITVTSVSQKKEVEGSELRVQLDRERRLRRLLEDRLHTLEAQMYPENGHAPLFEQTKLPDCKVESEVIEETPVEAPAVPTTRTPATALAAPHVALVTPPAASAPAAPLLEAAIKAEPRVEVEVLPDAAHEAPSRLYLASTSRQNLETIVEAIRHLEGDHLFREESGDAPLALTKKAERAPPSRPGVIVVKHS